MNSTSFDNWIKLEMQQKSSFAYWYNILQHIEYLLIFVRSFREADFPLLIASLEKLTSLFIALDRHNYGRWVPVFIQDLKMLKTSDEALFQQFMAVFSLLIEKVHRFLKLVMIKHKNITIKRSSRLQDTSIL